MSELEKDVKAIVEKDAEAHARFLAEAVFIPAYKMAFIHGYKHGYEQSKKEK